MGKKKKKDVSKKLAPHAFSDECNCPLCIFTKSQAPGDAYDLENCPQWSSLKNKKDKK